MSVLRGESIKVQILGFRVNDLGFRVQGSGFRILCVLAVDIFAEETHLSDNLCVLENFEDVSGLDLAKHSEYPGV